MPVLEAGSLYRSSWFIQKINIMCAHFKQNSKSSLLDGIAPTAKQFDGGSRSATNRDRKEAKLHSW